MKTPNGRYRIQAVAETTGVPAATLRQWERRYGVPSPDRTASAYRVYSDADIEDIQRMQALAATGVSPSEAAQIITAERDAAESPTREDAESDPPTAGATVDDVDPYLDLRRRLLTAIEGYDHATLASTCRRLLYMDGATTLFERVVAPVMREVGQRWHQGTLTVAQEHLASEAIGQVVRQLLPVVQPPDDAPTALLACFRDELHTLPLYGVAFRLAHARHRTVVLGARAPRPTRSPPPSPASSRRSSGSRRPSRRRSTPRRCSSRRTPPPVETCRGWWGGAARARSNRSSSRRAVTSPRATRARCPRSSTG